ncbi:hypothetical protein [Streptomyces sp. NBC_00572]|nr:hypothetical protein [Streptomyces sp. NBC_00572]MCX4987150.1 hypothetical protein [Streptomyces sp. NBC_00572]
MTRLAHDRPAPECETPKYGAPARLYPCGWRCDTHRPVPRTRPQ